MWPPPHLPSSPPSSPTQRTPSPITLFPITCTPHPPATWPAPPCLRDPWPLDDQISDGLCEGSEGSCEMRGGEGGGGGERLWKALGCWEELCLSIFFIYSHSSSLSTCFTFVFILESSLFLYFFHSFLCFSFILYSLIFNSHSYLHFTIYLDFLPFFPSQSFSLFPLLLLSPLLLSHLSFCSSFIYIFILSISLFCFYLPLLLLPVSLLILHYSPLLSFSTFSFSSCCIFCVCFWFKFLFYIL